VAAYNAYLSQYITLALPGTCTSLTGTLAGDTLAPGTYCFDAAAAPTGVLTLNGPSTGIWTFKIGTGGTGALTGTDFSVVMAGGGQACNVTWWVAEGTTMTRGAFQGNILAGAAITFTGPGTFNGNAWAGASGTGDVTFGYTKVTGCATGNGNGNGKDHRGDHGHGRGGHDGDKDHRGDHGRGHDGDKDHRGDQGNDRGGHDSDHKTG
jgi:hypothetical protein